MNSLDFIQNDRITDGRRARSWWHEKAKEMIVEGFSLGDIADHYGVTESAVRYAVRDVYQPKRNRSRGKARPGPRGWWHNEARSLKSAGQTLREIADRFGVTNQAVLAATRDIPSSFQRSGAHRKFSRVAEGHGYEAGFKRVSIGFTGEQVTKIASLAEAHGKSFSAIVAGLVDEALSDQPSEFERCMK